MKDTNGIAKISKEMFPLHIPDGYINIKDGEKGFCSTHGEELPCCVCSLLAKDRVEAEERKSKMLKRLLEEKTENIKMGKRYAKSSFDDFIPVCKEAEENLFICKKYAQNFATYAEDGIGILFTGNPGTGKNMLAAAICNHITRDGHSALHTTAVKLVRKITDNWASTHRQQEQTLIDFFVVPDLLVIDEIGVQLGNKQETAFLTEVINERYENIKPTLLITNVSPSQLEDVLGARIFDRITSEGTTLLQFGWGSTRNSREWQGSDYIND